MHRSMDLLMAPARSHGLLAILQDDLLLHDTGIHCLLHDRENERLIAGAEDGSIIVHYMDGHIPVANDQPLPSVIREHEARVTGLVLLPSGLLVSVSLDKSIRVWDLSVMKQVGVSGEKVMA